MQRLQEKDTPFHWLIAGLNQKTCIIIWNIFIIRFALSNLSSMSSNTTLSHLLPVWLSSYEPGHTCFLVEPLECLPPSDSRRSSSWCPGWRQTCPYWPRSTRSGHRPPTGGRHPAPHSPRSTNIQTECMYNVTSK